MGVISKEPIDLMSLHVTMDALLCILDEYTFTQKTKQIVKILKANIEPQVDGFIDECYKFDSTLIQELGRKKDRLFKQLAVMREYELSEISDLVDEYVKVKKL